MKHYIGEVIDVYDGDFIGWTIAELTEFISECGGYERWRMKTKEGSELMRLVGFDEKHKEKPIRLYQPIKFKRWEQSKWEKGFKMASNNGAETFLEEDRKTIIEQVYDHKVDWGIDL